MTRRLWACPSAVAAALLAVAPVFAQQAVEPNQVIKQGFEAAWARQPEQRAAALRRDAAGAALRAAESWTPEPPALELSAKTDRFIRNDGGREYEVTVAVPLWLPQEQSRTEAVASAEASAVDAKLFLAQWQVAGEVREAYWAFQRAQLAVELAQQRQSNARRLAQDVARRVTAGDLARSDGHQAEAAVAAADSAVAQAAVESSQAAQRWLAITGKPPVDGGLGVPEVEPTSMADAHPLLRDLSAKAEVARLQRGLAGAQTRANPELTLGASRERGELGESYGQAVILGVRIPLGSRSASQARLATASADQLEAETQLALEQERLDAEVKAASDRVAVLRTALMAAERRALLARESLGFFEKSFRLGRTDLPTRLRIELDTFEAEREVARSRIEVAAAISTLRQTLGLLPQ